MSFGVISLAPNVTVSSNVSGDNTALTLTLPATTNSQWMMCGYSVSTRGAAVSGDLSITIKDSTAVVWRDTLGNAADRGTRIIQNFVPPIPGSVGNNFTLNVPAGGAGVFIAASIWGFKI